MKTRLIRVKARAIIFFFMIFFVGSHRNYGQITRQQIVNNANQYTTFTWTAYSSNCMSGGYYCSSIGRNVYAATPANSTQRGWVIVGTNTSMPYAWNGWSTISEHINLMTSGSNTQAGDICHSGEVGGGCEGLAGAPLSCASGHDCSGLVSRAWVLGYKHNTSTDPVYGLASPNVSTLVPLSSVLPGDILNKVGSHTRLVESRNTDGSITVIEASGADWKCAHHTYQPYQLTAYDPRCPNPNIVIGGCGVNPPANDDCSGALIITAFSNSTCGGATSGDISNATQSIPPISCGGYTSTLCNDVWFKFIATSTNHIVTVTPSSGLDAVVDLRTGDCNGTSMFCSDNGGGEGGIETINATGLNIGTTYYVRVYDYTGNMSPPTSTTFTICVTTPTTNLPDLIITAGTQSVNPATVSAGSAITAYASENNIGNAASGTSVVGLWLSQDNILQESQDIHFGDITGYPALAAGSSSSVLNSSVTIPASISSGTYYLFFWADGNKTNNESNEGNNFASTTLTVTCSAPSQPSTINGPASPCRNSTGNVYFVTNISGVTYTWSYSGTGATLTGQGTNIINVSYATGATSGTWSVTPVNGCGSGTPRTLPITLQNCGGGPYTLTIASQNPASGIPVTVSPNDNNGNGNGSTTFQRIFNVGTTVTLGASSSYSGTVFAKWLKNGSDYSMNPSISFSVFANDTYTAVYSDQGCTLSVSPQNQNVSYSAGSTYFNIISNCSWSAATNFPGWCSVTPSGNGSGTLTATYTQNTSSLERDAAIMVSVNGIDPVYVYVSQDGAPCNVPAPTLSSNSPVCEGSTLTLTATSQSGAVYYWSGPAGFSSNNNNISILNVTAANAGSYSCYVINNGCQSPTASISVSVNPAPSAGFTYSQNGNTVTFTNTSVNASTYNWTFGDGGTSILSNPSHTFSSSGYYNVCLTAGKTGCNSSSYCNLITIGAPSGGPAHPTFVKLYKDNSPTFRSGMCYGIVQSPTDSGYIGTGMYQNPSTINNVIEYFKTDKNGSLIWARQLPEFSSVNTRAVIASQNGYLLLIIYNYHFVIMEIDEQGNKLWGKSFNNISDISKITKVSDGYILAGTTSNAFLLIKVDNSGTLVWQKQYNFSLYTNTEIGLGTVTRDQNSNIYISGTVDDGNSNPPWNSYDGLLFKAGSDGSLQWCKSFSTGNGNVEDRIGTSVIDNNSDLVFTGYSKDNFNNRNGFIAKVNSFGTVLLAKQVGIGTEAQIFEKTSGSLYGMLFWFPSGLKGIASMNSTFDLISQKQLNFRNDDFRCKIVTLDNRYVFSGQYTLNASVYDYRYSIFKLSLDASSCLDTVSTGITPSDLSISLSNLNVSLTTPSVTVSDFAVSPVVATLSDTNFCPTCILTATITPSGSTTICSGSSVTLTANAGMTSYLWSSGQTTRSITATTAGNYWVTVTDAFGCSDLSQPVAITVLPSPLADAGPNVSICSGNSVYIGSNPVSGYTYNWSPNTGLSNPYVSQPVASPGNTTNYILTVTDSSGCASTDQVIVTVKPLPTAAISGTTSICSGGSTMLSISLTGTSPWSITYTDGSSTMTVTGITTSPKTITVTPSSTRTYSVTNVTDATGCANSGTGSAVITVTPFPVTAGIITGPTDVYQGQTGVPYSITPLAYVTGYQWVLPSGATITSGNNTNSILVSFSLSAVSGTIKVRGTNSCGAGGYSPDLSITVNPPVPATLDLINQIVANGQSKCYDASQTITVAGNGNVFFVLSGGMAEFIAGNNIRFLSGVTVLSNGYLHGSITINGSYCGSKSQSMLMNPMIAEEDMGPMVPEPTRFRIYPNPTTGNFTLEILKETPFEGLRIEIYGMRGEKILTEVVGEGLKHEFSISDRTPGIYFIRIIAEEQTETVKLVKL